MKKLITIVATVLIVNSLWGQNKVYWVHGLGDDSYTWNTYSTAIVQSQNRGTGMTWYASNDLANSANSLNGVIYGEVPYYSKAIVFGHSAGGLIARQAAQSNYKIRAVITAGTPNNGAGIVQALNNNTINRAADLAIVKLNSSINMTLLTASFAFPGLAPAFLLAGGGTTLVFSVGDVFATSAINDYKSNFQGKPAVNDMNPNLSQNTFLSNLNSATPRVPVINLYGNEDDYRLVRLAGTALHKTENDSNTTDNCYDQSLLGVYNGVITTCTALEIIHYAAGAAMAAIGIWTPYYFAPSAISITAAASWNSTKRYIQYDVHNEWDSIIGAVHTDRVENWHRFLWWTWCDVSYVTVYENSDGFIPNNSSKMDESKGPDTHNYEITGVNHLEMNSHYKMRNRLTDILKNGMYGQAFNYNY